MRAASEELEALPFFSRESGVVETSSKSQKRVHYLLAVGIHLCIFLLYAALTLLYLKSHTTQCKSSLSSISFTQEELSMSAHYFSLAEDSIYAGNPSTDLDQAWDDLLSGINIRVSHRELAETNQTSVKLQHNQDYLAWLEVSHQLHCVKFLRQSIYHEHYFPEIKGDREAHWLLHTDHCVELLRQAIMCHADTSLMTFKWDAENTNPMLKLDGPQHSCVDWDELKSKMRPRLISDEEMSSLKNPFLRKPF